jgi:hypothetical protein
MSVGTILLIILIIALLGGFSGIGGGRFYGGGNSWAAASGWSCSSSSSCWCSARSEPLPATPRRVARRGARPGGHLRSWPHPMSLIPCFRLALALALAASTVACGSLRSDYVKQPSHALPPVKDTPSRATSRRSWAGTASSPASGS